MQKKKTKQQEETQEEERVANTGEQGLEDVDDLLDEIDDVLEEYGENFIKNYRQAGGE